MSSSAEFADLLAGEVEDAWPRALAVWRTRGRVEDHPKGVRFTKYSPDEGKRLGLAFAEKFATSLQFVTGKLGAADAVEAACAYDILELIAKVWMSRRRDADLYLGDLTALKTEIPPPFLAQIRNDWIYNDFKGTQLGDYFDFIQRSGDF